MIGREHDEGVVLGRIPGPVDPGAVRMDDGERGDTGRGERDPRIGGNGGRAPAFTIATFIIASGMNPTSTMTMNQAAMNT